MSHEWTEEEDQKLVDEYIELITRVQCRIRALTFWKMLAKKHCTGRSMNSVKSRIQVKLAQKVKQAIKANNITPAKHFHCKMQWCQDADRRLIAAYDDFEAKWSGDIYKPKKKWDIIAKESGITHTDGTSATGRTVRSRFSILRKMQDELAEEKDSQQCVSSKSDPSHGQSAISPKIDKMQSGLDASLESIEKRLNQLAISNCDLLKVVNKWEIEDQTCAKGNIPGQIVEELMILGGKIDPPHIEFKKEFSKTRSELGLWIESIDNKINRIMEDLDIKEEK